MMLRDVPAQSSGVELAITRVNEKIAIVVPEVIHGFPTKHRTAQKSRYDQWGIRRSRCPSGDPARSVAGRSSTLALLHDVVPYPIGRSQERSVKFKRLAIPQMNTVPGMLPA